MRKVLNILESCSLAYKTIPLNKIYEVTGRPSPDDIKVIYNSLTKDDYNKAFALSMKIKSEKSLSVDDIIRDIHKEIMRT